jgi:anti-sigma regulatory factor (Ser/Thr protein kinase)
LPARPESVTEARHRLRDWLRNELPELDSITAGDLELAFCEACTNVVRHAYDGRDEGLRACAERNGAGMELSVEDQGRWRPARSPDGGRGLGLMRALCDELVINHGARGTRVTMRWSDLAHT